jgi:histidinol phosphatase-like PHP family hydrolase
MKVDLHVHAKERSSCARAGEEEMIQAAISRGLDGLAFTDHYQLIPRRRVAELNARYAPFCVFAGIETRIAPLSGDQEGEDLLVLGLDDSSLETRRWTCPELHAFVRGRGGFMVLAHPFRFRDTINIDVEQYPPDAIELHSKNIRVEDETRIRALAERLGVRLLCNSDAHQAQDVGLYYNVLPRMVQDARELVTVLQNGDHCCAGR